MYVLFNYIKQLVQLVFKTKKKKIPIKIDHEIMKRVKRFFGNNLDSHIQNIIIQLILLYNVVIL